VPEIINYGRFAQKRTSGEKNGRFVHLGKLNTSVPCIEPWISFIAANPKQFLMTFAFITILSRSCELVKPGTDKAEERHRNQRMPQVEAGPRGFGLVY
jgi:hypothetical protein